MLRFALPFVFLTSTAQAWDADGFEHPESIVVDAAQEQLFVSNIVGHPAEADGEGYISRVSMEGSILDQKWATGMDAPKGMALFGNTLLVTDLTQLHVIDRTSGEILTSIKPEGAQFLNDIAAAGERAFMSDMFTGQIYSFDGSSVSPFYKAPDLPHPNGLWTDGTTLVIGHWGPGMKADFTTETPGDLIALDIATKSARPIVSELGNLDGVAKTPEGFIVNDWLNGKVYSVVDGQASEILAAPQSTADITTYGDTLYLPHMFENRISTAILSDLSN